MTEMAGAQRTGGAGGPAPAQQSRSWLRRHWQLVAIALVFAAPVIASYMTYYVLRPGGGQQNYGTLIEPQRALPDVVAVRPGGERIRLPELEGQWLLVSVSHAQCDATCENNLYLQHQLRTAMGKERDRVDWVWLIDDDQPVPEALQPALRGATILRVDAAAIAGWLQPQASHRLDEHLYLVDPLGHWMMRFPAGMDTESADGARRDMRRLLRASGSWDRAGRTGAGR